MKKRSSAPSPTNAKKVRHDDDYIFEIAINEFIRNGIRRSVEVKGELSTYLGGGATTQIDLVIEKLFEGQEEIYQMHRDYSGNISPGDYEKYDKKIVLCTLETGKKVLGRLHAKGRSSIRHQE